MTRGGRGRDIDPRFATCRTWLHAWEPTTVEIRGGQYEQGLRCLRCGCERTAILDAYGHRIGDRRKYPEGYLLKGGGGTLTIEERAELRLFEVTGHLGGRDELARRRRSRRAR